MAWKPKTIAGKIIKGAVIGGGSILGLAAGVGTVGGIVKGVGAVAGGKTGLVAVKNVIDKVAATATNLVTGTTKAERDIIKTFKARTKEEKDKIELFNKLVKAGATEAEARSAAGIKTEELQAEDRKGAAVTSVMQNKTLLYAAAGLLALVFLPKLLKR